MASPVLIEPQMQKSGMDCVIACLSALLGKPYRDVADAAKQVDPNAIQVGLTAAEAVRVAKRLGATLKTIAPPLPDLEESTGVLYVKIGRTHHAVVLFMGVIFNPADGLIYAPEAYFAAVKGKPVKLLVVL